MDECISQLNHCMKYAQCIAIYKYTGVHMLATQGPLDSHWIFVGFLLYILHTCQIYNSELD